MGGTARSSGSAGENIVHWTALRFRVQGTGNLKISLHSQDDTKETVLKPLPMSMRTAIQPTRLCNFMQQRAFFRIGTEKKDEFFRINRIIVFTKEVFSSYPG